MARTVDPERHEAQRLRVMDAALTVIADHGYRGATTAVICREAGIGSGTFFHYFPAKADVLLAILHLGTEEVAELRERAAQLADPMAAIAAIVDQVLADARDERIGGFVRAVAAVMHEPKVAEALQDDERAQREMLAEQVDRARAAGQVRTDLPVERLVSWVRLLLDGFLERIATEQDFTSESEGKVLRAMVLDFLSGRNSR